MKFEKVSFEQYKKDCQTLNSPYTEEILKMFYDGIRLPQRATKFSAGYDFFATYPFLAPTSSGNPVTICTGIRVCLEPDEFLMIVPRSGKGFKTGVRLANSIGIIDADYAKSQNEGHIMAKFCDGFDQMEIKTGDAYMQGIVMHYSVADDDETVTVRNGGFGSTDSETLSSDAGMSESM